jgi:hypothetical protein
MVHVAGPYGKSVQHEHLANAIVIVGDRRPPPRGARRQLDEARQDLARSPAAMDDDEQLKLRQPSQP